MVDLTLSSQATCTNVGDYDIQCNLCIKDTLGPAIFVLSWEVSSSRRVKKTLKA